MKYSKGYKHYNDAGFKNDFKPKIVNRIDSNSIKTNITDSILAVLLSVTIGVIIGLSLFVNNVITLN